MPTKEVLDLGLTGLALIVVWKVLDFAKCVLLRRQNVNGNGIPLMGAMACQVDPQHFAHIKETSETVADLKTALDAGHIGCVWKGRDEVRDLLELMRNLLKEIQGLRKDISNGRVQ